MNLTMSLHLTHEESIRKRTNYETNGPSTVGLIVIIVDDKVDVRYQKRHSRPISGPTMMS